MLLLPGSCQQDHCGTTIVDAWHGASLLVLFATTPAAAQTQPPRPHIDLPPAVAGTPLSFQIQAEAEYVAARGDMEESMAMARKIHAEAVVLEIQNSIDYVDAHFRRREINRQWRAKRLRTSPERREEYHRRRRQQFETRFQDVLRGDVTAALNWLLAEVSRPALAYQYISDYAPTVSSPWKGEIPPDATAQIWFSDSGSGHDGLVFCRRYLRCLAAQVHRAIHTRDPSLFDGTLCFKGNSVLELVVHMNQRGWSLPRRSRAVSASTAVCSTRCRGSICAARYGVTQRRRSQLGCESMAVEIHILSGARRGAKVVVDATEFRVGTQAHCAVVFDPVRDAAAADREIVFCRCDDGWYVKNEGADGPIVNRSPLHGRQRLRSGDVVRMSDHGPDFSFRIIAAGAIAAAGHCAATRRDRHVTVTAPAEADRLKPASLRSSEAMNDQDVDRPSRSRWFGLGVAAAMLLLVGLWLFRRSPPTSGLPSDRLQPIADQTVSEGEARAASGNPGPENLHYATELEGRLVERWLRERDSQTWVEPMALGGDPRNGQQPPKSSMNTAQ